MLSALLSAVSEATQEVLAFREAPTGRFRYCTKHCRHRFFAPTKGFAAACLIHEATWCSSRSSTDASSTPRVDLPIPIGVTGGSGLISVPRMNISFTWPTKAPDEKHQPPSTP